MATSPPPGREVETASPVKMASIASGSMDLGIDHVSVSLDDFRELRERQRAMHEQQCAMQERIDLLEEERKPRRGSGEEAKGLLASQEDPSGDGGRLGMEGQTASPCDEYEMPESVYTFLTTEEVLSIPFATGIATGGISLMCLILALVNELDNKKPGNPLGLPAGVQPPVRTAQYLGVIIGVVMDDEIPQALELIGKGAEQEIPRRIRMRRLVFPAILRMLIGYTFLACLFLTVVQESNVLGVFFDVLALEFVENIDDILYNVCKKGFLGRSLKDATNNPRTIEICTESHAFRRRTKRFIRFIYIFNILMIVGGLTIITVLQRNGRYRCNLVSVSFGDALWEDAYVTINGDTEKRLLIYSHFNGIYKEADTKYNGKPKYIEQNKEDGSDFKNTKPAEIIYCQQIESWVLRHEYIKTSNKTSEDQGDENECNWLLRSPSTESYDLVDLAEELEWFVWTGLIESDYPVSIECVECHGNDYCNYNGICKKTGEISKCNCDDEHFGLHCQFKRPCKVIRSEKNSTAELTLLGDPEDFVKIYGRPQYVMRNMSGKPYSVMRLGYPDDDESYFNVTQEVGEELVPHKHFHPDYFADDFFVVNGKNTEFEELLQEYTFVLLYTGRRWYGKIVHPKTSTDIVEEEYHAFWMNAFSGLGQQDNSTLLISAPSSEGSPVGVDFFEMRRRNIEFETGEFDFDYSPYGVLLPLVEYEGSGFFHCIRDD